MNVNKWHTNDISSFEKHQGWCLHEKRSKPPVMPQNSTNPLHRVMNWKLAIIKERSFGKSLKRKRTLLISDKLATRDFPELSSQRLVKPKNNGRSFNDRSITYRLWAALAMVWVVAVREQSLVPNLCQSWVCNLEQSTMTVDLLVVHCELHMVCVSKHFDHSSVFWQANDPMTRQPIGLPILLLFSRLSH